MSKKTKNYNVSMPNHLDPEGIVNAALEHSDNRGIADNVMDRITSLTGSHEARMEKAHEREMRAQMTAHEAQLEAERTLASIAENRFEAEIVNDTYFSRGNEYSMVCESIGRLSRNNKPIATQMAKGYISDMVASRQIQSADQEFRHAQLMYRESRGTWMLCACITTFVAVIGLAGMFAVLTNMAGGS